MINLEDIDAELTSLFETITAEELQTHLDSRGYKIEVVDLAIEREKQEKQAQPTLFEANEVKVRSGLERDLPDVWQSCSAQLWALHFDDGVNASLVTPAHTYKEMLMAKLYHPHDSVSAGSFWQMQSLCLGLAEEKLGEILVPHLTSESLAAANSSEVALAA